MPKTPSIHLHAATGNLAAVVADLATGTPVDLRDPGTDRTPLMVAVSSNKAGVDLVQLLIERGADVNATAADPQMGMMNEHSDDIADMLESMPELSEKLSKIEGFTDVLENMRNRTPEQVQEDVIKEKVLSLAINAGNPEKVCLLLDAGADIHYTRPGPYDVLLDAMHGHDIACDPRLLDLLKLLIGRGARLNTISKYGESALSVSSHYGRFDAVRLLLDAGADPAPLEWTLLMQAIALGSLADVEREFKEHADLTARDGWHRTPWLLSLQVGDIAKAKLLLSRGADRNDRGKFGQSPLTYPITNNHAAMLRWLLDQGFDSDEKDQFEKTPLMEAIESGNLACVQTLLDGGASIGCTPEDQPLIRETSNLDIVHLLVKHGADLNDISDEARAGITRLPHDRILNVSLAEYQADKHRRFGKSNPEKMNLPFWVAMIRSGLNAYGAREHFGESLDRPAVWCFQRFGKSMNILPDGRIIEVAGEHEDHYDPDFCIYNDVVVHHPDGSFDIYGYPAELFPPTDFHTATLVGKYLYIIGNLGYLEHRRPGQTQVFRLNLDSYVIEPVPTTGENPGWISRHKAAAVSGHEIRITGGKLIGGKDNVGDLEGNAHTYILDVRTNTWRRIS